MTFEEQTDFVRNLKGAASSILWILLLSGRSLTARQLEAATSYSDKPISRALAWLEPRGYVQNNGRQHGWSLGQKIHQLSFPFAIPVHANGLQPATYDPYQRSLNRLTDRNNSDLLIAADRKNSELPHPDQPPNLHSEYRTRKISEQTPEKLRSTAPDLICTVTDLTDDQDNQQPVQTRTETGTVAGPRKNSEPTPPSNPRKRTGEIPNPKSSLAHFLHRIEMRDPAYTRILARDNFPEVLAWYWQSLGQEWMDNPSGWLVRRLDENQTPLPAYLEFAQSWLIMTDQDLDEYYQACCHPYGPQDYWHKRGLTHNAITAFLSIKKTGGLNLFDDFPRPIITQHDQLTN